MRSAKRKMSETSKMEINFDLLIAGCNTRCMHCYVNGGPAKAMKLADALTCLEKLDSLAALLPGPSSFTLDNEPMNHPEICRIIPAAARTKHIRCFHHGMTTGIALMARPDRDAVMQAYLDAGFTDFGITLHGSAEHHDMIVRRPGAFRASVSAAEYMKAQGADISVSLMFNRYFPEDAEEIDKTLSRLQPGFIWFAIPNYTPHRNMPAFEPHRGSLEDLLALCPWLTHWRQNADDLLREAATVGSVKERLEQDTNLQALFSAPQAEMYLTVHPDCHLYMGNTGVETRDLGDLRTLDIAETAALISAAPGNRDYGAFYDVTQLPDQSDLVQALARLPQTLLYSDRASVIYRGLAKMGVPTKISRKE